MWVVAGVNLVAVVGVLTIGGVTVTIIIVCGIVLYRKQ